MKKLILGVLVAAGLAFSGCEEDEVDGVDDVEIEGVGGSGDEAGEDLKRTGEEIEQEWEENVEQPVEREIAD